MKHKTIDETEKEYDKQLQANFVAMLKSTVTKLTPGELKKKVITFLKNHRICTLATCSQGIPRSTPVRYRSKDLTIYIFTEGGGKVKNIRENPQVSVSVVGTYYGFQSVTSLQLWGTAEIISHRDGKKYEEAKRIINLEARGDLKKIDLKDMKPMDVIKIKVRKARYLSFPEGILNQVLIVR